MNETNTIKKYTKVLKKVTISIALCIVMISMFKIDAYADFGSVVQSSPFMEAYTTYTIKEGIAFDPEVAEKRTAYYYYRSPHSAQWPALNYDSFHWDEEKIEVISFSACYDADENHRYIATSEDKTYLRKLQERLNDTNLEFFKPIKVANHYVRTDVDFSFKFKGMGRGENIEEHNAETIYLNLKDGKIYDNIIVGFGGSKGPYYESFLIGKIGDSSVMYDVLDEFVIRDENLHILKSTNQDEEFKVELPTYEWNVKKHIYSNWAYNDLYTAETYNIVPTEFLEEGRNDLTKPITRREFCYILYEAMSTRGHILEDDSISKKFNDVNDYKIAYAANIGVVDGTNKGNFEPDRYISRQEAAKILYQCAIILGAKKPITNMNNINYHDDNTFSNWARFYIKGVNYLDIMYGIGNNNFGPHETYSKEQAIITFVRLLQKYRAK